MDDFGSAHRALSRAVAAVARDVCAARARHVIQRDFRFLDGAGDKRQILEMRAIEAAQFVQTAVALLQKRQTVARSATSLMRWARHIKASSMALASKMYGVCG